MSNQNTSLTTSNIMSRPAKETLAQLKTAVDTGDIDASYLAVIIKKFAKFGDLLSKDKNFKELKETLEEEVLKHQEGTSKTFYAHGAKITAADGGFWNYATTDDPVLKNLLEIEKDVKAFIKQRKETLQIKAAEYNAKNKPGDIVEFGLKPFIVSWDDLPKLVWEDGWGEIQTNPPTKVGKTQLRFTV
jgi:hypothetical protein